MARYVFRLPDIGEGIAEAEITAWHVKTGERLEEDQPMADVMTDKATVEMTSPVSGLVTALHGEVGQKMRVGSPLVELELDQDEAAAPRAPLASPATRRRAQEMGIALQSVPGTGPEGRITSEDLGNFTVRGEPAKRTGITETKLSGLRGKIAEKMQEANRIPHFSYIEECDLTELEALRKTLNDRSTEGQPKLTLLPFFMRALVRLIPEFPQVNARYDEDAGILRSYDAVHIGIATQTQAGLMVPVIHHAETRDLWDCARELARVTEAARDGRATRDELTGSTITLTSLGALGGIAATPIINRPEVAIIGPNKLVERPVVLNGRIAIRTMMNLSSSFDHRIIDGFDAAQFVQGLKRLVEHPGLLFLDQKK